MEVYEIGCLPCGRDDKNKPKGMSNLGAAAKGRKLVFTRQV